MVGLVLMRQLAAGERFVMDNAFFTDFLPEVMDTVTTSLQSDLEVITGLIPKR